MKLMFDFLGMDKRKAFGVARHNERVKGFYEGNIISGINGGEINPEKIKDNIIFKKIQSFNDLDWLGDVKVAGGRQKKSQEFTGWVIQAGGSNNKERKLDALSKTKNIQFLKETHNWITKQYGEESIMGSVIQFDETTPQLQIVMNNKTIDEQTGKVYVSSKRKFGFVGLTKQQARIKAKELQNKFYKEVAIKYGIESPSKELGTRGKVGMAEYKLEKKKEEDQELDKSIKSKTKYVKMYDYFEKSKDIPEVINKTIKTLEHLHPEVAKAVKVEISKKMKKPDKGIERSKNESKWKWTI